MSLEIAWKQNILVTGSNLLKLLLVVLGFICGFSRQNICSVSQYIFLITYLVKYIRMLSLSLQGKN
jgi:hypothetical protein